MPKFSANLGFLCADLPFLDRCSAAAKAGFAAVECASPYEHDAKDVARRLADHGLTQALFNLPSGDWAAGGRGLAILPGREGEFRDGVARALDYANALGCERLNCLAGLAPPDADRRALEATFLDNLAFAAEAAARRKVRPLIEPIDNRDMPGFYLNRTDEALLLIERVASDNLFLQADIYHMQVMEGESRAAARSGHAVDRPPPDRRQSRPARAGRRRNQLRLPHPPDRPPRLRGLGRLRIPSSDDGRSEPGVDEGVSRRMTERRASDCVLTSGTEGSGRAIALLACFLRFAIASEAAVRREGGSVPNQGCVRGPAAASLFGRSLIWKTSCRSSPPAASVDLL